MATSQTDSLGWVHILLVDKWSSHSPGKNGLQDHGDVSVVDDTTPVDSAVGRFTVSRARLLDRRNGSKPLDSSPWIPWGRRACSIQEMENGRSLLPSENVRNIRVSFEEPPQLSIKPFSSLDS